MILSKASPTAFFSKIPSLRLFAALFMALALSALAIVTLIDFLVSDLARRSLVFYDIDSGELIIEERMVRRAESGELDLARYVEEALLGSVLPNALPLFPKGTRLRSLLYRNGTVYADFSAEALLPPPEGGEVLGNFRTLREGVLRNFPRVGEVRFFIDGTAAFAGQFR
ncbi:MAG: GerMN domain-containing protein [Treponema sp.]|nr:GerMN domain-containing protein [Treponema sp.]